MYLYSFLPCIYIYIYKIKCTVVQVLRLRTGSSAHSGSRGIALLFLDHGTRRGWGLNVTPRPLFTPGKEPVPIVQESGQAPGPVWTCAEYLAPTVFPSPDLPARSQLLYRLSYRAHTYTHSLSLSLSDIYIYVYIYGVCQEECARLRKRVP